MKQFECTNTFTSSKGEFYAKGTKIYENEYYTFTSADRSNFKEVYSDLAEFSDTPISKGCRKYDDDGNPKLGTRQSEDDYPIRMNEPDVNLNGIFDNKDSSQDDFGGGDTGGASDDF